ncbi:hypothetical protein E3P77_03933 [Wallemia ichthyophaga]|uniref:Cleavage and polyadenylation specificity factor subunit 2 n=1 Tax=Wallemia ichthyophaga TaxID=245174 RepID=A0A4T0I1U3_WALIC|nr:hypothetical protein E3P93_03881 [Wallemia ichthyophaga]TIB07868.1 hypothetical protein E3P90_03884 [Wallemia ichthyophaga]TIB19540.1 hypothetical protein E3P89_03871 [Wallemia ichthyophaga]TIB20581.1 hypothetical protein E3P88_03871 [Wallemia ichthyophaga]TIB31782.1 hypothetical protein E3P84_02813 [Wallemia ichthyophaga]
MAITVTPLAGSGRATSGEMKTSEPLCYLMEMDGARILLDCGSRDWEANANPEFGYERALKDIAPTVDLVLISHASTKHSGLYAYAYTHYGLTCPAYCSLPVKELARLTTLEDIIGWRSEREITGEKASESPDATDQSHSPLFVPTREENRSAWSAVKDVRYHQPQHLYGKLRGVTITAYSSGHTLGGTLWKIRAPSVGTILYAVGLNHMKERHLDGTALIRGDQGGLSVHEQLVRPGLVITDSERGDCVNAKRKDRDAALLDLINRTLQNSNSVLLPCDPTTRILELLVLLDQHWSYIRDKQPSFRVPLCLISNTGNDMLKFVRGLMEFFGGATAAGDNTLRQGRGVLEFKTLNIFTSVDALEATHPNTPKVVLAVPLSMSYGSSRRLFSSFASTPGNAVVLTSRGMTGSLARDIFDRWNSRQGDSQWGSGRLGAMVHGDWRVNITQHSKIPLLGQELEAHQANERLAREQEAAKQAADSRRRRMMEADAQEADEEEEEDDEDDDKDSDKEDQKEEEVQQVSFDIFLKGHSTRGATSFFKTAQGSAPRFRMFPFNDTKRKMDSYGEVIDADSWVSRGKEMERQAIERDQEHEAKRRKMEEEADATPIEPPSKYISEQVEVDVRCQIMYVDLEGLNDSRAIKNIMPRLNPRKMILVGGSQSSSHSLIGAFDAISAMTKDIYVPAMGETVTIGEHTHSYTFTLGDSLVNSVHMAPFEDFVVGHAIGTMKYHEEALVPTFEEADARAAQDNSRALPTSLFIGDMKLTALKAKLVGLGMSAEFGGEGVLICWNDKDGAEDHADGAVAVSKNTNGELNITSSLIGDGDIYYTVREAVYGMHAVIPTPA